MPIQPRRPPYFSQQHRSWVIPLTRNVIALVDKDIALTLGQDRWQAQPSREDVIWYATRGVRVDSRTVTLQMHRLITGADPATEVDHRKHHPFELRLIDNRRANLRVCTHIENSSNQRKKTGTKSAYKGVSKHTQCAGWIAAIGHHNRIVYLGYFLDDLEAALAYDRAARELHGEFAATNKSLGLLPHR